MTRPLRHALLSIAWAAACIAPAGAQDAHQAEPATRAANQALTATLPWSDTSDFDDARRGFVAAVPDATVTGSDPARPVWSMKRYAFLQDENAPDTVNPSLWRQARLNAIHGLFKVSERVYQVRGMDLSNITIVEGNSGLILIDPLISTETAKAALDLYLANRPKRPVVAVIYSHSHVDHFGGVKGVIDEADVKAGKVQVIAPDGFMEHAVAENVLAGNAMTRRAQFMYGPLLPAGPTGQVDTGLGKNVSRGTVSLIAPTDLIKRSFDTRTIDGVEIVFHLTPGTEAPSEMNMYFPQLRVLDMAENTSHNMHNLYTLRGAEVRDGNAWSHYLSEAIERFAPRSDVLIGQHHWPTWGTERLTTYMARQRDLYKFINDQSLRLINMGKKPDEIAAELKLPKSLADAWSTRGYYGTLSHNARAVYQKYMGFYDGNPANLEPLPPVDDAKKAVEYMGGGAAVIARARDDYAKGNYRWVASVMKQVVFADPANQEARRLGADALEQLGYQAEAGTWRNEYLYGAFELRRGVTPLPAATIPNDLLRALPMEMVFDSMGTRLNAARAEGKKIIVNWTFTDTGETYALNLENSALTYVKGKQDARADVTLTLARPAWDAVLLKETTVPQAVAAGRIQLAGNGGKLAELFGLLDNPPSQFEIVEPLKPRN
jgi:alkyl sulfatase BDS1-like metallo-beta-lactamase superfamily hydrolase